MDPLLWFRRLLKLLPADFQADYARDMERTFDAQHREASQRRGVRGVAALWWETLRDLLRTAPREHLDQLGQDVSYALRSLRVRPAATVAAVATLAMGIGGVTAIASVVNGVDWRPLGYPDARRVVYVKERYQGEASSTTSYATFADWRDRSRSFSALAAASSMSTTLFGEQPEQVIGMRVTPGFFGVLGVQPVLGRGFTDAENRWENRRFAVLSAGLWRRRFGSDPQIVGRAISLAGVPYVVTGVMPDDIEDLIGNRLYDGVDLWAPLAYDATLPFACRTCRHLRVFGRLRPDATREAAEAELDVITRQLAREHGGYSMPGAAVERIADALIGPIRPALYLLLAAVGVLLAIAAINVANLMLARSVERTAEIATRRALGVASGRLVRQLLTESLVLAALGAVGGVALAYAGVGALVAAAPPAIPRIAAVVIDGRVLALTVVVTGAVGLLFGLLPAWHLARVDIASALRGVRATGPAGGRHGRLLVSGNVVLAVVLLAVTALLGRSLAQLLRVDPGFDAGGVTVASLSLAGPAYNEQPASLAFYRALVEAVGRPGDTVALTTQLPMEFNDRAGFHVVGRFAPNPEDAPVADRFAVTSEYFRAMRIPVRRGRAFTEADQAAAPRVAVINETAARELFGGGDPIGRQILLGGRDGDPYVVVGIVGDVRHRGLGEPFSYQAYVPLAQHYSAPVSLVLRTPDDAGAVAARVRGAVASIDRMQAVTDVRPLRDQVSDTLAERRFLLSLIAAFAAMSLSLAVVGLYGVVSYVVAQRTRDIGVRVALGAEPRDVRRFVLGLGMRPVLLGLVAGVPLVALAGRTVAPMLVSVGTFDPAAIAGAAAVLFACALAACYVPARRATRVDPIAALRAE